MCQYFALDNHRTSVCCKSVTWSLPISLHSAENTREIRGLAVTKLTIFTVVSKCLSSCQACCGPGLGTLAGGSGLEAVAGGSGLEAVVGGFVP